MKRIKTTLSTQFLFRFAGSCALSLVILFIAPVAYSLSKHSNPAPEDLTNSYSERDFERVQNQILSRLKDDRQAAERPFFLSLLASTYLKSGDADHAELIIHGLRDLDPQFALSEEYAALHASAAEKSNNPEKALTLLQGVSSDRALFQSGCILERMGQSYAAVTKLQELIRVYPQSPLIAPSRLLLASSYIRLKDSKRAKDQLALLSHDGISVGFFKAYFLGAIFFEEGDMKQAFEVFSRIPTNGLPEEPKTSVQFMSGLTALRAGDVTRGESILSNFLNYKNREIAAFAALELVKTFLLRGESDRAVAICNTILPALVGHPLQSEILLLRGISAQRAGQPGRAIKDFEEAGAVGTDETRDKTFLLTAHALWFDRQFAILAASFADDLHRHTRTRKSLTDLSPCFLLVGQAQLEIKNYEKAEEVFSALLNQTVPSRLQSQAAAGLISSLVAQSKFSEADKKLEEFMTRFAEDRAVLNYGMLVQGHLQWNKGDTKQAAQSYEKYAQMFPSDPNTALVLYMAGRSREILSQSDEAFEAWDQLRADHPDSPFAFRALARSAALAKRLNDSRRSKIYYGLMTKSGDGQLAEVAQLHMALTKLEDSTNADAIKSLSLFIERHPLSKYKSEAVQGLRLAYQREAGNVKTLQTLAADYAAHPIAGEAYYWLGIKDFENGQTDKAIQNFNRVLTDYPQTPSYLNALFYKGQSEYQNKNYKQALVVLGQFIKSTSDKDLALVASFQRASALLKEGFYEEACRAYEKITVDEPSSNYAAEALLKWGQALEEGGDRKRESSIYETFLREFPSHKRVNEINWKMGHLKRQQGAYGMALAYYRKVTPTPALVDEKSLRDAIQSVEKMESDGGAR